MTDELKLRMTEIARKWMRPDSEAAPEFYWGDFYDCVAEIMGAAGASEGQADARRTAEYWKAEHLAGNAEIAALRERIAGMEKDAEPVGEFVGYQKIGFQQVPIIAWDRHVPMGTKLYAAPVDSKDTKRLDFVIDNSAFLVWRERDGSIVQCQLYKGDDDENVWPICGDDKYFNSPREAIDAAIAKEKP